MDLNTLDAVVLPRSRAELADWPPGTAALGGGTWLFSEPQPDLTRLLDLSAMGWPDLMVDDAGLHIGGTCTIAKLSRFVAPPSWRSGQLIGLCCESLLGSFKIWNAATVGGNICLALPAGPMTSLAASLGGIATLWGRDGGERNLPVAELVLGERRTALAEGEILRSVLLPLAALRERFAFRRISLTPLGRSGALLIGTRDRAGGFTLTVTAATPRPVRLTFPAPPTAEALAARVDAEVSEKGLWHDDIHGDPAWRRHVSQLFAAEILEELR